MPPLGSPGLPVPTAGAAGLPASAAAAASSQAGSPGPSGDALRASIAERFTGAYEAQLGYLQHVAAVEQRQLQSQNDALRHTAYLAQRQAAEQRAQTEALRTALGQGHLHCSHMREAIHRLRAEVASEAAAIQACDAAIMQEEAARADLEARVRGDCAELHARVSAAQKTHRNSEERAGALAQELSAAREEQSSEARAAQSQQGRARAAEASREQALQRLRAHEETAVQALGEGIARLEGDFARERNDFAERSRRAAARVQQMEEELDIRSRPRLQNFVRPGMLPPPRS